MTREHVHRILRDQNIPQIAVSIASGVSTFRLSTWLRGADLRDEFCDRINLAVSAMLEVSDTSPVPPDWRQIQKLKPQIDEIVVHLRHERSARLRREFETGSAAAMVT